MPRRSSGSPTATSSNPYPLSDPTTRWAWDVVNGRIVSGHFAVRACQRHLDDIEYGGRRGVFWRPDLAKTALEFFPDVLRVTAGAKEGEPFNLPSYSTFVVGSLYGWVRQDGRLRFRRAWLELGKGQLKALAVDTPIATPTGWTTMGCLQAGDWVFDDRGVPCRVIQAHDIHTARECYAVRFDDGEEIIADEGHLWRTEARKSGSLEKGASTRGVPRAQRGKWRKAVRTTEEIARTLRYRNGKYQSVNHSIPLAGGLDLPDADLPIPPYILGCWLGDGDSDGLRITVADQDAELLDHLAEAGGRVGPRRGSKERAGRYQLSWPSDYRGMQSGSLAAEFRALELIGNKHIPRIYLRASREQRAALLQGLMDTDGTIALDGQCTISSKWLRLAAEICELVVSLGMKAAVNSRRAFLNGRDVGPCHCVTFYPPVETPVFRLARKAERQIKRHSRRRLAGDRRIVSCERVKSVPVRCITVDAPSQMFLAGRSMVPTHNSPLAAALGLYTLAFRGIARAECYAIAKDRNQANVLFADAVAMCNVPIADRDDGQTLLSLGTLVARGTGEMTWMLEHPSTMSKFRALAGDEKVSGPRPSFVAADEIHEWRNDGPLRIWQSAGAKMPGDFLLLMSTNTPAADQLVGTEYSAEFQRILRGEVDDDAAFAFIARVDETDDPLRDETCWVKAMPCLDLTFPAENVRIEVNSSRHSMGRLLNTKRLYFGIPVGTSEYWIDIDAWERVQEAVDAEAMKGKPCWLGMDLSEKNDLTALAIVWRDADGHFYLKVRYWKPEEGLALRAVEDNAKYPEWAAEGLLHTTPGKSINYDFVALAIQELCAEHEVQSMAFDPAHITEFRKACDRVGFDTWIWEPGATSGRGLKMIVHSQGRGGMYSKKMLWMPRSMGQFEDLILTEQITIDDNQITKWCAGNAAVSADEFGNRYLIKKHRRGRIDGVVAAPMAVGNALAEFEEEPRSLAAMIF